MGAARIPILLTALLAFTSLVGIGGVVTEDVSASQQGPDWSAGEVVKITSLHISMPADRDESQPLQLSGNSSQAVDAPHLVELHTATWCIPCRTAEAEVTELETWWPAVEIIALHSSLDSPDQLATNVSREVYDRYQLGGYPTIVVDGNWILMGENQATDLQSLLSNLTENDRPLQEALTLDYDWVLDGENFSISWNSTSQYYATLDLIITQNEVPWPGTTVTLDNVVRGGLSNLSKVGNGAFNVNLTGGGDLTLTTILRIEGNATLQPGSEIPLTSGLPDSWTNSPSSQSLSPQFIAGFTIFLLIIAVIPMRHTLPVLWRKTTPNFHPIGADEEE